MANSDIFQFDGIHQVMQRDMGIPSTQTRKQRRHEAGKRYEGIAPERTEQEIEPDHVRFHAVQRLQQTVGATWVVERPATHDIKTIGFYVTRRKLVGQNGKVKKWVALQLLRQMKSILTQSPGTRWKRRHQTDLHSAPAL